MSRRKTVDIVVTYLEMETEPASYPPAPAGMQLALMRVHEIPVHFYRYLHDTAGRAYNWVERHVIDDETLSGLIHKDGVEIWLLMCNGAPAGFFELDFSDPDRTELVFFGVLDGFLGRGLGRYMLGAALREAWRNRPGRVAVNTCTLDHPAALSLYQKAGFEPVGRRARKVPKRADWTPAA